MKEQLATIRSEALAAFAQAGSSAELDALRVKYLGKKGELTAVLKQMGKLSAEERPAMGQLANEVRAALEAEMEAKGRELEAKALEARLEAEALDITVPGKAHKLGHKHPMYTALDEIKEIFISMGFTVLDGPEVELAEYNFDKLNAEEGHPSRDWSDTFYFDEDSRVMLRSQTSPMQVRAMETMELPIRIIAPGRVYRKDEVDATHSPMFHQVEGMVIDKGVTMADLKGTLNTVVEQLYGKGTKTRFRPHHFPFTEPSCEMDVQCHKCGGVGCPTCKGEGWIELLGAGMVHHRVLEKIGADRVVFPEQEMALRLARNLANGDILNFIELSEEYSIMECRCPRQWQGKSIRELDVRARHRLNIIAIRRGGGMTISPGGEYALQEEDELVVLGRNEDIREVERL